MGVLRDSDSRWYMREEAGGLILGPYEDGAPACYVEGPSKNSEYELFQEDLDRLAPHIEGAIHRVPAFGEVGVKKVYNGAICYTCLLYTSPSPRDRTRSRMPSSA